MRCPCVYCLCLADRVSFSTQAPVQSLTHSQSAKDIDPYFKFQLYMKDPGHRKKVLIFPNGLSKSGERANDRNFISAVGGWDSNSQSLDRQSSVLPLSYHHSLVTRTMPCVRHIL